MGDQVGRDVFFYSISIDPETDTPAELKRYKHMFAVGPGWNFLTGKKEDNSQRGCIQEQSLIAKQRDRTSKAICNEC